jgi:hypothetical protein
LFIPLHNGIEPLSLLLKQVRVRKIAFDNLTPKWPKLEEYVKNWIIDHRKNGTAVSTKMILIEARKLAIEISITDFDGTTSWCERFIRRNDLCMCTKTTIAEKMPCEYGRMIIEFHK